MGRYAEKTACCCKPGAAKNVILFMTKLRLLLTGFLFYCGSLAAQVPFSSIYQNMKGDGSPVIQSVYQLLDKHYRMQLTAKDLAQALNKLPARMSGRERAIKNMALYYTKTDEEDFGFYNLRLAVNDAEALPDNDIVKGIVFAEFGNYLYNRETHDLAIEFMRKSIPILEASKPAGMEGPGYNLENKILRSFKELGESDSVAVYTNKVIDHAKQYRDKIWLSSAYNNKGYRFYEVGRFDSALVYYQLAQSYLNLQEEAHLIFYENINENIAHIHAKKGEYAQALLLLDKVIDTRPAI
jgi:tetratricopeptide (TPR) repeat protein